MKAFRFPLRVVLTGFTSQLKAQQGAKRLTERSKAFDYRVRRSNIDGTYYIVKLRRLP